MCWNKLKDTLFTNDKNQEQEILNSAMQRLLETAHAAQSGRR